MDPTILFNWAALCCNGLLFLILGLILILWVLSPRVEGSYTNRPQRPRAESRGREPKARSWQGRPADPRPARSAVRETRRSPSATPIPEVDTSAISMTLSEAQRAAEAIGDIQIRMPVIPDFDMMIQMPDIGEALTSEPPWSKAAETVQATVDGETYQGVPAIAEAGTRAAVQGVAAQIEQAVPAAEPVTRRVKAAARQATNPLAASTLAEGIEVILQDLIQREAEHLQGVIHVEPTPEGGVKIKVADDFYFSVAEVPEGRAKQLLQQAVRAWNQLWQTQEQSTGGKR
ncbi:MAG: hypothetical protein KKA73_09735 [Chloroflexi bacterium]|nr:hypothetical protein [Chloroflexota bacterium]MBU1747958.1 hypothetical protein [Chloroflexota bacterium]MBU1878826.1 hypothetical protein [Chloroflexota bacterium]